MASTADATRRRLFHSHARIDASESRLGTIDGVVLGSQGVVGQLGRGLVSGWRDVVLGHACAGCGCRGELLCRTCALELRAPARRTIPTPEPDGLPSVWAVASYDGPVRAAICGFKEEGLLGLGRPLGEALASAVRAALARSDPCGGPRYVLIPVPSSRAAVRARGLDTTARLAKVAASALRRDGLDVVVAPVLQVCRIVADQAGLSIEQRRSNVAGAFMVSPAHRALLKGRGVVLVDDVVTTGATLVEAARALATIDAPAIRAGVVAATGRRGTAAPRGVDRIR